MQRKPGNLFVAMYFFREQQKQMKREQQQEQQTKTSPEQTKRLSPLLVESEVKSSSSSPCPSPSPTNQLRIDTDSPMMSPRNGFFIEKLSAHITPRSAMSHLDSPWLPGASFDEAYNSILLELETHTSYKRKTPAVMKSVLDKLEDLKHDPKELDKFRILFSSRFSLRSGTMGSGTFTERVKEHKYNHDLEVLNEGLILLSQVRLFESMSATKESLPYLELCCSELQSVMGEYLRFLDKSSLALKSATATGLSPGYRS